MSQSFVGSDHVHRDRQHGSAMIIALIILLLLTFLGFESMSKGTMGTKVASNSAQKVVSFHNAENVRTAARTTAETMASALGAGPVLAFEPVRAQGRYNLVAGLPVTDAAPAVNTRAFWNDPNNYAVVVDADGIRSGYVIEYLGQQNLVPDANRAAGVTVTVHVFRITINAATGGGADTAIQTTYVTNCNALC